MESLRGKNLCFGSRFLESSVGGIEVLIIGCSSSMNVTWNVLNTQLSFEPERKNFTRLLNRLICVW